MKTPYDRINPGTEFTKIKGFDKKIIRSQIQRITFLHGGITGKNNQSRCLHLLTAQLLQYFNTIFIRKIQIQHNRFLLIGYRQHFTIGSAVLKINQKLTRLLSTFHPPGQIDFIFND